MMASPLSRELRERNEFYPRRLTVRKGDVVLVRRGGFEGHEGKVLDVDLKSLKITIDGVVYQKADNTAIPKPIDPSNVEIIKLDLSDKRRKKKFERILEQSGLSDEEIREAEEELDATETIEIAALEDHIDKESEEESLEDDTDEESDDDTAETGSDDVPDAGDNADDDPVEETAAEPTDAPVETGDDPVIAPVDVPTDTPMEDVVSDDEPDNKEGSN